MRTDFYLGWEDHDKKRKVADKVLDAARAYELKFGRVPKHCLCSLSQESEAIAGDLVCTGRRYIEKGVFYVGENPERIVTNRSRKGENVTKRSRAKPTTKRTIAEEAA